MIQIVRRDRGAGKTTIAVNWFLENPFRRVLVVVDERERQRVHRLLKEKQTPAMRDMASGWESNLITVDALKARMHLWGRGRDPEVMIDNLDQVMRHIWGVWGPLSATSTEEFEVEDSGS